MKTVGAYEAKTHLSQLLDLVRKGDRIVITKHGTPIAVLQQPDKSARNDPLAAISEMREFREQHRLDGVSIRELIEEGRR